MPKRSNSFQRVVTAIYRALAPTGATVEESALVREATSGIEREVDILISIPAVATSIKVAIECRDHGKPQSVEWIDGLSGKYRDLLVDKVVAVSDSGFTKTAIHKAENTNIQLVSSTAIETTDWANELVENWRTLHLNHVLFSIAAYDDIATQTVYANKDGIDQPWKFRDELSSELSPTLANLLRVDLAAKIISKIETELIVPKWETFKDGEKRYCEVGWEGHCVIQHPLKDYDIKKIVYGLGTIFTWTEAPSYERIIHNHLATELQGDRYTLTLVSSSLANQPQVRPDILSGDFSV